MLHNAQDHTFLFLQLMRPVVLDGFQICHVIHRRLGIAIDLNLQKANEKLVETRMRFQNRRFPTVQWYKDVQRLYLWQPVDVPFLRSPFRRILWILLLKGYFSGQPSEFFRLSYCSCGNKPIFPPGRRQQQQAANTHPSTWTPTA